MQIKRNGNTNNYHMMVSVICLLLTINTVEAKNQPIMSAKPHTADPLLITLRSYKVQVGVDGKEALVKADKVKPGDVMQYAAVYHNRGKTNITGLKASLPIPLGMEYLAKSSNPSSAFASVDSQHYSAEPLMRTGKDAQGNTVQVAIPYVEYQQLQWDIGSLDAGKKLEVSARMRVSQIAKSPAELVANRNTAKP